LYSIQSTSSNVTVKCGSAGPHFNPLNQTHGDISAKIRHVGDYGNIVSDNDGNIFSTFNDTLSTLYGPLGNLKKTG
jgi:superoxide dismutase, Cu-Zn family